MIQDDIDRDALIRRFVDDETLALLLVGSRARGDHAPSSDIDLARHVALDDDHGRLVCTTDGSGRLVTLKTLAVTREEAALQDPAKAVWQVPALRDAVILFDRHGAAAQLIEWARAFSWDDIGDRTDRHVAAEVAALAEEALKVAGGLEREHHAQVLYGTIGLVVGLAEAVVVHRRLFISSENRLFDIALEAMAVDSEWTAAFHVAAGFDAAKPEARGRAALALYARTVLSVASLFDANQRRVADLGISSARRLG